MNRKTGNWLLLLLLFSLAPGLARPLWAGGRLFFAAIAEPNEDRGGQPQIVLRWGALDGRLPAGITRFRLYRAVNGGDNQLFQELIYRPEQVTAALVKTRVDDDLSWRKAALLATLNHLNEIPEPVNGNNFADLLAPILNGRGGYAPLQRMILSKRFPALAAARGEACFDRTVSPGNRYTYTLTAIDAAGRESSPLGRSDAVDPGRFPQLPAPADFRQVRVGRCDNLRRGLDDNLIRFAWRVPWGPGEIGRSLMTLGYDIFWSATDLGPLDLRAGIPAELKRLNQQPITVSGPPPQEGPDAFLALDEAANHEGIEPPWQRGQRYYYYLVPIDLLGRYGGTSPPLAATVVDAQPPRAVWNVETMEVRDDDNPLLPRLALFWDRVDSANFVRQYGFGKTICRADRQRVCYLAPRGKGAPCENRKAICEDFDIASYCLFRFDSPEEAIRGGGADADGDLWSDNREIALGTDPCDPGDHPAGNPEHLIARIMAGENEIEESPEHIRIRYIDRDIGLEQRGRVYWYRIVARDQAGNTGAFSPPIRGILYNRTQPRPQACLQIENCRLQARFRAPGDCPGTPVSPAPDDILIILDRSKEADLCTLSRHCRDGSSRILFQRSLGSDGRLHLTGADFDGFDRKAPTSGCEDGSDSWWIAFFDPQGRFLARTQVTLGELDAPSFQGWACLEKECEWKTIPAGEGLGQIPEEGRVRVCVDLEEGEMARLYREENGHPTPFAYITTDGCDFGDDIICTVCRELEHPRALSGSDLCLGIRVFSQDHVGSGLLHLGCLSLPASPRTDPAATIPAPMLATVDSLTTETAFVVRWAASASAIAGFTLLYESDGESRVLSLGKPEPDARHQFSYKVPLAPADLNRRWCFKLKAYNSALETSPWSNEVCAIYENNPPADHLGWPPVPLPPQREELVAFYLAAAPADSDSGVPAIVLSADLSGRLAGGCADDLSDCPGDDPKLSCLDRPAPTLACPLCDLVNSSLQLRNFIVYRQQEGGDFVQVSPLLEKVHCSVRESPGGRRDTLDDPYIHLLRIAAAAVAGGPEPAAVTGTRLIFSDRYPHIRGTRIRYRVLLFDPGSGEISCSRTSNWVEIPE